MSHGGLGIEHLKNVEPIGPSQGNDLFTATDLKLDRRVVVRILPAVVSSGEGGRFLDQARALAGWSRHRNIVTVFDAGITADGRPYLVSELVDGPSLAACLDAGGAMPWTEACGLALQLAAALEQIHQAGGRHRDLRPENVLLAGSVATLTDVGLLPGPDHAPDSPTTLAHRAPETLDGDGDDRSDLYSLASILHLMIDGRAPFWRPADTVEAFRARLLGQPAPALDPELVPPALAVFVTAGLSADPLDRPQDVHEFVSELRLIVEGRVTGSTPSVLHAASGPVPSVQTIVATDNRPTTVATLPADQSGGVGFVDPGPEGGTVGEPAIAPSWAFDTAELTSTDGRPMVAAGTWAPPTRQTAATTWGETSDVGRQNAAVVTAPPDLEAPPLAFELPPAPVEAPATGPVEPAGIDGPGTDDQTTLIPTIDAEPAVGPTPRPLLLAAGAMIAVGLLGLVAVLAIGLRDSDREGEVAAPVLADPNAPTEAGSDGQPVEGAPTTLTPLAMLPSSTTTTLSDEMVTSTDTTIRRVAVPNLVDLDVAVAGQRLSDLGFDVLVVGRVSPGSLPGTVIQQTPAAGSTIELPATVNLFIPRSATLPSMVGRPADTVCLQLTALGLRCEQTLRFDERVAPGAVIATNPTEGSAFADGQTIRLDVSRGPLTEARIPPVTGLSEDEARTALGGAGFVVLTTVTVPSANVPAGQAIGTDPAAGTSLTIDQSIAIQISSGPAPMVTVPELVGLDRAAAEVALQRAQLTGSFVTRDLPAGDPGIGRVLATDPGAAAQVPAGSAVRVTVGQATPGSTTTTMSSSMTTSTTATDGG